ncbi:MAG: hypothetical protein ACLTK0_09405 [Anaerovoracaceae bacterium]
MVTLLQDLDMSFFAAGVAAVIIVLINFVFAKRTGDQLEMWILPLGQFLRWCQKCLTLALVLMEMPQRMDILGICAGIVLLIYFILWIRYFKDGCYYPDIYMKSFLAIPVPFDVFISLYFIMTSLWLSNIAALGFSLVYAVSRMANAFAARRDLRSRPFEQ